MSAEVLREAAALMRARATDTSQTQWQFTSSQEEQFGGYEVWTHDDTTHWTVATCDFANDAEHIASWHPAVALAVADWLDAQAVDVDSFVEARKGWVTKEWDEANAAALDVARAYLGADQ